MITKLFTRVLIGLSFFMLLLLSIGMIYYLFAGKYIHSLVLLSEWGVLFYVLIKHNEVTKELKD